MNPPHPPLPPIASRAREIEPFRVMAVLARARELEAQGRDIVHLEIGEPDFSTAEPIVAAGQAALALGQTRYTPAAGLPELREAIAQWYAQAYGAQVGAERILVTPGASGALLLAVALLVEAGQTLLLGDPGYPCNRHFLRLIEASAQMVPVGAADRFQLTAALAAQHWQPQTAGVLVASPANPTGEILDRDALADLRALCRQRGGHLLVDEIYHGLVYEGSAPSIVEITNGAFAINSFSKFFGMTGWRVGWMVAPAAFVPELEKLAQNLFIAPSTPAQYAALAAFTPAALAICNARRDELHRRRDFLLRELRALGFGIPHAPAGAFYLYADASRFTDDSERFCADLLEQHGVALTPGTDFGHHGARTHVRFAYTTGMERLEEAIRRLRGVCR